MGDTVKSMRLRIAVILGLLALVAGCSSATSGDGSSGSDRSSDSVSAKDAYAVGCPLVNTALGAGRLARKVAAAGLGRLIDRGDLTADQKEWLTDAKQLMTASKPEDVPAPVRNRVKQACEEHGQSLSNF